MVQENVSLKEHTSFKIGGSARYFLKAGTIEELISGLRQWKEISVDFSESQKRIFVLGGGTNLVISENGFPGLVIHPEIKFMEEEGNMIEVGAGEAMSSLVNFCMDNSLSGFEWAGGLPGTVGGAVRGNAGAFGGETKDSVIEVKSVDINSLEIKIRSLDECRFGYRDSVFKSGEGKDEIVVSARFSVSQADADSIRAETDSHIEYRKNRHPLHLPNAGSIFKNVPVEKISSDVLKQFEGHIKNDPFPVLPAAKIISQTDLLGKSIGGAQVSTTHPNFIVNTGSATAEDIKQLIAYEQSVVKEKFGIELEPEVMLVG